MKKRLTGFLTAAALLLSAGLSANAHTPEQERAADALNELGMFLGTGTSYELDNKLNRVQGITLLVRLMGMEAAALSGTYETPFTDVPDWAAGYVGYAYENGITNGTGAHTFGSDDTITDYMFLTLVLRALGYTDSGDAAQFVWNDPYALAEQVELISSAEADAEFTRGDAVVVFWNAMSAEIVGTGMNLKETLIAQGVIEERVYIEAEDISINGRVENPGIPLIPVENNKPNSVETPLKPEIFEKPEIPVEPETPEKTEPPVDSEISENPETLPEIEDPMIEDMLPLL